MQVQDVFQAKADEYKAFLNNRLSSDLQRIIHRRALTLEEQRDYKALQTNIQLLLQVRMTRQRSKINLPQC